MASRVDTASCSADASDRGEQDLLAERWKR